MQSLRRPGPRRCGEGGGGLSRRRVSLVPRAAAPADSPAQPQVAAARGRAMLRTPGAHRPSALAMPRRALFFHSGDPRDVLPPRPASVGEQGWPPSLGPGEIGHEEACCPPHGRMRAGVRKRCSHTCCRCRARPCNCNAMSTLAAQNSRARSRAHKQPRAERAPCSGQWEPPAGSDPLPCDACNSCAACRRTCARSPSGRRIPRNCCWGDAGRARPKNVS